MHDERLISLNGTYNFRDFGGYKTADGKLIKKGMLYRSGNLSRLSKSSNDNFNTLQIKLIIDLRSEFECAKQPNRIPDNNTIRLINIPISIVPEAEQSITFLKTITYLFRGRINKFNKEFLINAYKRIILNSTESFSQLIKLLTNPDNLPVLIHCQGGKDRTGIAAALILLALGIPENTVKEDYCLTDYYIGKNRERLLNIWWFISFFQLNKNSLRPFFQALPEYFETSLNCINSNYESITAYLKEGLLLSDDELNSLKNNLLE